MKSLPKVILGFLAIIFFGIGLAYLPFFVWIGEDGGPTTLIGLLISIGSLLIPWAIGLWFAAEALKETKSDKTPPTE